LIRSVERADLFREYCSPCHGPDCQRQRHFGSCSESPVPDLTQLAKSNHGQFPASRVHGVLNGDVLLVSHGSQEMPIWGPLFHQIENDKDWGNVRMANLVKYLESIQAGPIRPAPRSTANIAPRATGTIRREQVPPRSLTKRRPT